MGAEHLNTPWLVLEAPLISLTPTGGGQLDLREASLLHVAFSRRVDVHLEHPPPRHHLHGPLHRRHPPRHIPQHHDRQAVNIYHILRVKTKCPSVPSCKTFSCPVASSSLLSYLSIYSLKMIQREKNWQVLITTVSSSDHSYLQFTLDILMSSWIILDHFVVHHDDINNFC